MSMRGRGRDGKEGTTKFGRSLDPRAKGLGEKGLRPSRATRGDLRPFLIFTRGLTRGTFLSLSPWVSNKLVSSGRRRIVSNGLTA